MSFTIRRKAGSPNASFHAMGSICGPGTAGQQAWVPRHPDGHVGRPRGMHGGQTEWQRAPRLRISRVQHETLVDEGRGEGEVEEGDKHKHVEPRPLRPRHHGPAPLHLQRLLVGDVPSQLHLLPDLRALLEALVPLPRFVLLGEAGKVLGRRLHPHALVQIVRLSLGVLCVGPQPAHVVVAICGSKGRAVIPVLGGHAAWSERREEAVLQHISSAWTATERNVGNAPGRENAIRWPRHLRRELRGETCERWTGTSAGTWPRDPPAQTTSCEGPGPSGTLRRG